MANIGSFKKSGNEFQGEIVTLSLQAKGVRIIPETNRTNDNAPSHRVYIGRESRWAPPGRSALPRAATISRSSSTIRASTRRSTPTSSRMRTAKATPSSGRAAAKPMATERTATQAPSETSGGAFVCALPRRAFQARQLA